MAYIAFESSFVYNLLHVSMLRILFRFLEVVYFILTRMPVIPGLALTMNMKSDE